MLGHPAWMVFIRHCQIPLADGNPSIMYENACLNTAHRKYCHLCLSGPSSQVHSGASLWTPISLGLSLSHLLFSIPPLCLSHFWVLNFPSHGPLLSLMFLSLPGHRTWVAAAWVWDTLGAATALKLTPRHPCGGERLRQSREQRCWRSEAGQEPPSSQNQLQAPRELKCQSPEETTGNSEPLWQDLIYNLLLLNKRI